MSADGQMRLYFDGRLFKQYTLASCFLSPHQHYFLINLAVGGNWYSSETGRATDDVDVASIPWEVLIDYFRLYR